MGFEIFGPLVFKLLANRGVTVCGNIWESQLLCVCDPLCRGAGTWRKMWVSLAYVRVGKGTRRLF